ncbi:hypothetical protein [Paenibacillus senegalensis]|uniref:hypothetical protein n=1 Tax=Paenibacillus senegalensis TaxID=1465766 RepID=UPI00028A4138|nr:hypothetical protein [Paenibacillus senegalensis]
MKTKLLLYVGVLALSITALSGNGLAEKLQQRTELGVQLVITWIADNQVELVMSEQDYNTNKEEIMQGIEPEAIKLRFDNYKLINQPGEEFTLD